MDTTEMSELKEKIEQLQKQLLATQARLSRADELLSEGLEIIQDVAPGYDVFISDALQYFGLEEE